MNNKIAVDGWKDRRPETGRKHPFFEKDRDECGRIEPMFSKIPIREADSTSIYYRFCTFKSSRHIELQKEMNVYFLLLQGKKERN